MSAVTYQIRPLGQWTDPETPVRRGAHVFKASWRDTLLLLGDEIEKIGGESPVVFQIDVTEGDIRLDGMLRGHATGCGVGCGDRARHAAGGEGHGRRNRQRVRLLLAGRHASLPRQGRSPPGHPPLPCLSSGSVHGSAGYRRAGLPEAVAGKTLARPVMRIPTAWPGR